MGGEILDRSYYLMNAGQLKRKDNSLQFIGLDGTKKYIPIETIYDIYNFTDITINADLLEFLGSKGIALHFFNYNEYYSGTFYPREKLVSGDLLVKQVEFYSDKQKRTELAKKFVLGSAENIIRNLRYYKNRGRDLVEKLSSIEELIAKVENQTTIQEIMGIEGNIRKTYYSCWDDIVNQTIDFDKRTKQPPENMINTLISFLNSVFYSKVLSEMYKTQLNPTISYLHEPSTKRFSLSLDISEIFKPLIVDRLIFQLLNKNMITPDDFVQGNECLVMKETTVKKLLKALDEYMMTTIHHRELNQDVSYRHLIRLELYKLIKHLIGDKEFWPFKIWW